MKRSRIASRFAPFVVTVMAGGATLSGCSTHSEVEPDPDAYVAEPECPASEPTFEEVCDDVGQECKYGICMGSGQSTLATCTYDGRWRIETTYCDPPLPEPAEETP